MTARDGLFPYQVRDIIERSRPKNAINRHKFMAMLRERDAREYLAPLFRTYLFF